MSDYKLKCDLEVSTEVLHNNFGGLSNYLKYVINQAIEEAGLDRSQIDVDKIAEEATKLRFVISNIPFHVKIN